MSWNSRLLDEMFYYPPEVERTNVVYATGRPAPTVGERHDAILRRLTDAAPNMMSGELLSFLTPTSQVTRLWEQTKQASAAGNVDARIHALP